MSLPLLSSANGLNMSSGAAHPLQTFAAHIQGAAAAAGHHPAGRHGQNLMHYAQVRIQEGERSWRTLGSTREGREGIVDKKLRIHGKKY